jgi:transcription antitermination factor NusG
MERHWYAVHTYSGHENKVKTNIERRAESMGLKDRIFRILIPTEQELRTRGGKKREVARKIFPGYVLIEMVLDDTVNRFQETTAVVQNGIIKPLKQISGLTIGFRTALSVLLGPRRTTVEQATHDEEMFI